MATRPEAQGSLPWGSHVTPLGSMMGTTKNPVAPKSPSIGQIADHDELYTLRTLRAFFDRPKGCFISKVLFVKMDFFELSFFHNLILSSISSTT